MLGKDDYIFDRVYVDSFNRRDEVPATEIEARVQRMLLLQQHMLARGSAFLFLITPSKAELYPEYLPDDLVDKARQQVPRSYDKLKPLLDRYGIQYFDAHALLAGSKSTVPFTCSIASKSSYIVRFRSSAASRIASNRALASRTSTCSACAICCGPSA